MQQGAQKRTWECKQLTGASSSFLPPSLSVSFALSSLQKISPPSQFKWNLIVFWQKAKAMGEDCKITKPVQEATLAFSLPGASSRTHFERILSQ